MFLLWPSKQNMFPTLPKAIVLSIGVFTNGHFSTKPVSSWAISNCNGANFFQGGDSVFGGEAHHNPQGSCGGPCWPTILEAETYSAANCALIHGTKIGKNVSLSHSEKLKQLLKARLMKNLAAILSQTKKNCLKKSHSLARAPKGKLLPWKPPMLSWRWMEPTSIPWWPHRIWFGAPNQSLQRKEIKVIMDRKGRNQLPKPSNCFHWSICWTMPMAKPAANVDPVPSMGGFLAMQCSTPKCTSWVWMWKLHGQANCAKCGKPWMTTWLAKGGIHARDLPPKMATISCQEMEATRCQDDHEDQGKGSQSHEEDHQGHEAGVQDQVRGPSPATKPCWPTVFERKKGMARTWYSKAFRLFILKLCCSMFMFKSLWAIHVCSLSCHLSGSKASGLSISVHFQSKSLWAIHIEFHSIAAT